MAKYFFFIGVIVGMFILAALRWRCDDCDKIADERTNGRTNDDDDRFTLVKAVS